MKTINETKAKLEELNKEGYSLLDIQCEYDSLQRILDMED